MHVAMEVSDILSSPSSGMGTVHGMVVGQVSPIKSSSKRNDIKYFDSQFTDGVKTLRLVSFEPRLRSKIEEAQKSQRSVTLENCTFKRNRDVFEIHVNNRTSIVPSPKKFKMEDNIDKIAVDSPELGTLEELKDLAEHQLISVRGKVQSVSPLEQVLLKTAGKQLTKWEVILTDGTAACRCVLWEQHIDEVEEGNCYNIANATVRSFNGSKYVSVGEKSIIKAIENIGDVVDDQLGFAETGGMLYVFHPMHCLSQEYLPGLILVVVTTCGEVNVLLATRLVLGWNLVP